MSEMIVVRQATEECARWAWRRCLEGLDNPEKNFGPGIDRALHPAERHYWITADDWPIGLAWVRRFINDTGEILRYGFALFPECRGRHYAQPTSRALITQLFTDYPEARTLIAMIWGSHPLQRWRGTKAGRGHMRYVGELLEASATGSLHMTQITRTSWEAWT
jgi:hypothetical protein